MKVKFFIIIFKYRLRHQAFNNFLKRKKIQNNFLLNLSGPFKHMLFYKIFKFISKFFDNICLISCDGLPLIEENGVNIWFGGTSIKLDKLKINSKKNCFVFDNFIKKEKNLISFYPTLINITEIKNDVKIVFIGDINLKNINNKINEIWIKNKKRIYSDFTIIEKPLFWNRFNYKNKIELLEDYINLKNILRYSVIESLNKLYPEKLFLVGNIWKKFKNSIQNNYNIKFVSNIYSGNICLDFGSKWGDNSLYPRSIQIIENGGLLLQVEQKNSYTVFKSLSKNLNFKNFENLQFKLKNFLNNKKFANDTLKKVKRRFNNDHNNSTTLNKIFQISKKVSK
jgi:hypothetical protein